MGYGGRIEKANIKARGAEKNSLPVASGRAGRRYYSILNSLLIWPRPMGLVSGSFN